MSKTWRIYLVSVCFGLSTLALAEDSKVTIPAITNWPEIEKNLKLKNFKTKKMTKKIRIAILDNGFNGYESLLGNLLPKVDKETGYAKGDASAADGIQVASLHGTFMALISAQVIAHSGIEADYEMKLFNAFGYTKFKSAVDAVIKEQFDIVLYSQVWEFGGNGDGKGFINAIVDKAVAAGIIWINAAGNFGYLTRVSAVDGKVEGAAEYVVFKDKKGKAAKGAKILCKMPKTEKCRARIVLSWNDFKDDSETGTEKDLDLILISSKGKEVATSERRQMLKTNDDKNASLFPRELVELDLEPGEYWARAKVISKNFSASQDKLRVTVGGSGLELADSDREETLLPPADNPGVVVVGASDDFQTSRSVSRKIPEVLLPSAIKLKDGSAPFSTSIAAAMAAGLTIMNLGLDTEKTKDAVIAKLKEVMGKQDKAAAKAVATTPVKDSEPPRKISIPMGREDNSPVRARGPRVDQAGPAPAVACLPRQPVRYMYPAVDNILRSGAVSVFYRGWTFILVDPRVIPQVMQMAPGMRLFIGPEGLVPVPNPQVVAGQVPPNFYEILPIQLYTICN